MSLIIRSIALYLVLCISTCINQQYWLEKDTTTGSLRVMYRVGPAGTSGQTDYANIVWANDAKTDKECYWVFVKDEANSPKKWKHFSGKPPSDKQANKAEKAKRSLSVGDTDPSIV